MFDFITYKLLNLIIMHNSKGIQRVEDLEYNHGMLTIGSDARLLRVKLILLFNNGFVISQLFMDSHLNFWSVAIVGTLNVK